MPMKIRIALTSTALIGVGLILAACGSDAGQIAGNEQPAEPEIAASPTSIQQSTPSPPPPTVPPQPTASLPDLGPAPDITNEVWLNTDQPLNLELLRGEVVLVEFWTFG